MKKFIPPTKNKITALAFAILPVLVTGLLAYGANIYYDLDAAKIVNSENNELTQNLTVAGSVGIGTTSPAGALHVMGQCVTGDTKLRRRRKKSKSQGSNSKDEYEYEDVEIKDIKAGDEILTLDENTGRLTVSRVNALMDMGVKEIYKLTTATGKTIRTTANHPYLAADKFDDERAAVFVDSANFEMSCRFCGLEKDYVKMDKFFFGAMKKSAKTFRFYKVDFGGNKQRKFFDFLDIIGAKIVSKPIKVIKQKQKANEHKANFDVELAVDAVELKEKYDTAIIVSGDSDFAYLAEHLQKAGKKTVVISPWRRTGKELRQQADMYFDLRNMPFVGRIKIKRPPVGGINPGFSPALTILSQVHPFVKGAGRWTKVSQLREGQMIAVAGDNAKPQYERIAKIEKLPAEQVYDIEVEGTHNFVGNGIVAHNTYLQGADQLNTSFALRVQDSAATDNFVITNAGRVGIGTTSPAYTLDVNGGFRAGNATSTNALVFDPNTGNVGVGTTSPVQKLHVEGHCITGDSELAIVSPSNQEEQIRKIQIKDVQPGTQVLTLNEQTNRLEARAINKLLDMGVQAVFRLTTSGGKTIRTTGNHPYLAKISSAEQQQRISLREIGAMEREYGIGKNGLSAEREFSQTKTIWAGGSEIAATKKPACADSWTSSDSVQISGLSPNAIIADAPILSMAAANRRDFRVVEVGGIEPPNSWVTIQSSHRATPTTSELYHENDDGAKWTKVIYLSVGDEIATVSLDHRLSNSEPEVSWEKISSIEYVGQEQVYDIEVAGTHNFVANEILAHNTYISGNVGIGTTSPAEALDVNGRLRLAQTTAPATVTDKLYNVSGNLLWNGVNLTSGGALPVGTEGQMLYNNAGAWTAFDGIYWDDATSRLGIGTTAPIYKFNVAGANASTDVGDASLLGIVNTDTTANNTIGFAFGQANLSGTIQTVAGIDLVGVSHADGAQSGALAFSTRNAGSWSERLRIDNTGNVGIGTTAPWYTLDVNGTINSDFYRVGGIAALGTTGGKVYVGSSADYDFGIYAGAADRLFIQNSTGNVGIGTTSPGSLLHLNGALGALSGGLAFGDGDTGLYENYDDNFRLQTAGVDRITIDDVGNVGIGTTAPSGLLHVAGGQCVTGDTLLRVRRRRKRQNERGEWVEEEYFEDCRIDQVKAGDEILTLDENTGRLTVSRVNALMDMGVKEIYKLTTATGKTIRTTANHPYLARIVESKKCDTIKHIPSGEGHLGPAHFGIAEAKGHFSNRSALQPIEGLVTAGSALHSALFALNLANSRIAVFIDAANLEISVRKLGFRIHYKNLKRVIEQAGQLKYIGYFTVATSIRQNVELRNSLLRFGYKLVTKPLKLVKTAKGLKPKADVDVEVTTEAMERKEDFDVMLLFSGDSDFYYPIKLLQEKYGKKVIVISTRYCISDELFKVANYYIDVRKLKNLIARGKATKNPSFSTGESPCGDSSLATAISSLSGNLPFVKGDDGGRWTKVADICEGMEIATADENSGRAVWERIAEIEKLPAEQVYDIEVAGTHNFVGNGIVAHNTYLQGADQLNTSFALRVQDSAGADKFVVTNAGNVGIGTAGVSPTRRFEVLENTGAAPQMKIISDASNYSEFYVDATGDLSLKLTGSGGDDLILLDENLKICTGGDFGSVSCPTAGFTISGTGNLIVENKVIADKFEQICPTGYVWVPGSAKHGTLPGFCVMKYEAKDAGGGVAESKAADAPWVSVTQENARAYCQALGEGYHLVSEAEWMTIAENIAATPINDIDAVAGLQLATGHTDNNPANSLAAGTDPVVSGCNLRLPLSDAANAFDADCQLRDNGGEVYGYSGTGGNFWNDIGYLAGGNNKSQLRVHALSNGNTVWDIAGNVWEWTDAIISQVDQPGISNDGGAGVANWGEWNVAYYLTGAAANSRPPDDGWTSANGIGRLYTYGRDETATTTYRAFLRGGTWNGTSNAGVFALYLRSSPAPSYSYFGFRCAR